jgi:hypothetical protein
MSPVRFEADESKAVNIARILLGLIEQKHWLVSMPEYQLPRSLQAGSREHALYLTYIFVFNRLINSRVSEHLFARNPCEKEKL